MRGVKLNAESRASARTDDVDVSAALPALELERLRFQVAVHGCGIFEREWIRIFRARKAPGQGARMPRLRFPNQVSVIVKTYQYDKNKLLEQSKAHWQTAS
jgi:hypothetical protein